MNNNLLLNKTRLFCIILSAIIIVTYMPILSKEYYGIDYVLAEDEQNPTTYSGIDEAENIADVMSKESDDKVTEPGLQNNDTKSLSVNKDVKTLAADTSWYDKAKNAFTLTEEGQLQGLSQIVYEGIDDFKGKTIILGDNMMGVNVSPIGSRNKSFAGTFDGNGKSIYRLNIVTNEKNYIGLFGKISGDATIKNLSIYGDPLTVSETKKSGSQIRYVGSLVGYSDGNIENCESNVGIQISSVMEIKEDDGIIRNIGGLIGYTNGDIKRCSNTGNIKISTDTNAVEGCRYVVGEIGGIAGAQGDVEDVMTIPVTEDCQNEGELDFRVTGSGNVDRFGEPIHSITFSTGGILGQASGIIIKCTNSGDINTAKNKTGTTTAGRGSANTGGIVGNLRSDTFAYATSPDAQIANYSQEDAAYKYYKKQGGVGAGQAAYPKTSGIYDCVNSGNIIALNAVGGILGMGGSFTEVKGSCNTGDIVGCRWNKPFAAGVVGTIQGDVSYCYNRGGIKSFTGAGYYCAGIVGGLWVPHETTAKDNDKVPVTKMTGCYTTGYITTNSAGFKTGILAGENEGYIHDNVYISKLSVDNKIVESDTGTITNNTELSKVTELKNSSSRALLNAYASGKGNWEIFYVPDAETGYPVLSKENDFSLSNATNISSGSTAAYKADATYSAGGEPAPVITVKYNGIELVQNSDFYVIPQTNAVNVTIGITGQTDSRPYEATVVGMGNYTGTVATKVKYGIKKGNINDCTIVADPVLFNWKVQRPTSSGVKLVDSAGNTVSQNEYEVGDIYDSTKSPYDFEKDTSLHYYDYINCHGASYKYDVCVTAKNDSVKYQGTTTQQAFRINWASMMLYDPDSGSTKPESTVYGDVTWAGKTWDFKTALEDTTGNTIQITYTGKPITPKVTKITYLGKSLRLATDYKYQSRPLDYDYKYIYGNPNPEQTGGASYETINVTKSGSPTCMTIRFTNGGNFNNYENVFFRIVPADIKLAKQRITGNYSYTGKAVKAKPKVIWNGKSLKEGTDYSLSGVSYSSNKYIGKAIVKYTIKGKGNFKGTYKKSLSFRINPKKTKVSKLTGGKRSMKVTYRQISKKQAATSYQIRYRIKGKSKWKTKTASFKKNSITLKKLTKGKKYEVQVRAVKKIKRGSSKGTYYGSWSAKKTSTKIK